MAKRQGGNLPAEVSSFVGRRRELSEAVRLLSAARLVTLTGVGGVGKTRLAIRVAGATPRSFPDGAWLIELAMLEEPALLAQTVADALGLRDRTVRSTLDVLADHLDGKQLLLLMDNCEHVLDACAELVRALLARCPRLRVLATSRQALGIPGEHVLGVPPLPVPDPDRLPPSAAAAGRYDAIRLFADRVAAVHPGFAVTPDNYPVVARICTLLDGIPLAIELAARRSLVLSTVEILERLDDRFALLTDGGRAPLARHQTLATAIGWSYDLCTPAERELWSRLSVFSGGADLAAAEAVCSGLGIARRDVFDLVTGLVRKSLLIKEEHGPRTRYVMLDTIREYGRTRLSSVDELLTRRRHRDWYHRLAARAESEWFGPDQAAWCDRLRREHANLRVALDFCLTEPGEGQIGLAMATSLWPHWITYGHLGEGHRWLGLALARATEPTPLRAKALWITGWIAQTRGDQHAVRAALTECRDLAERFGYQQAIAYAVHYAGTAAMSTGDHAAALALFEEALAQHHALADEVGVTTLLFKLACCYILRDGGPGDLDYAIALCAECLRRSESRGEIWCGSNARYVYGVALWRRGDHAEAEQMARDSIRLKQTLNDAGGIGMGLELLAWIAAADGHHARAARLSGAARQIWLTVGGPLKGIAQLLTYHECAESQMRQALGDAEFDAAFRAGMELTLEEAARYALAGEAAAPPSLTRRELQVADLVAQGMSNKDIATALGVGQRTAESHVRRILTKLGVTSRAGITAWLAEQDTTVLRT